MITVPTSESLVNSHTKINRDRTFTVPRDGYYLLGLPGYPAAQIHLMADEVYTIGYLEDMLKLENTIQVDYGN